MGQLKRNALSPDGSSMKLTIYYVKMCGHALARAHARSGDPAMISGYLGTSKSFDQAIGEFASAYAEQNSADYRAFIEAIRQGKIPAQTEA